MVAVPESQSVMQNPKLPQTRTLTPDQLQNSVIQPFIEEKN